MSYCFECAFTIDSHDCDFKGELKPSGYLRYLQETANRHVEHVGFGYDDCFERQTAFVLSRTALDVIKPLRAYERVVARTTPADSKGYSFNRFSVLYADGAPAARLASVWALVNLKDRSLIKVSDSGLTLPTEPLAETSSPLVFRLPRDAALIERGDFTAGYSVCDRNRHMNNTRYPDMFCDLLPPFDDETFAGLSIAYHSEAPMGERLRLFAGTAEEREQRICLFRALSASDEKICCEAQLRFRKGGTSR